MSEIQSHVTIDFVLITMLINISYFKTILKNILGMVDKGVVHSDTK